ncbi:hypothetical protein KRX51_03995 [Corynebacterium sp. TAE3-ERU12]|uniref:hypothetical protein n=1 Tax=Corynebacterium sp. TAE3-ERU12 TaxID=2849491 RepID=UPI001C490CBF|nr:hypothetical protein [Corynebacterium sp. TAE3-ERU12]MBV7295080.1 hypothetical protein [Corynebacterium sp. TAE3-ERU12]
MGLQINSLLRWNSRSLASFIKALEEHENEIAFDLSATSTKGEGTVSVSHGGTTVATFQSRQSFDSGSVSFTSPVLTAELTMTPEQLLAAFRGTQDANFVAAGQFWRRYAAKTSETAADVVTTAGRLASENLGASISAATTHLSNLAAKIEAVSASATILAGYLDALPPIKRAAIHQLEAIIAESAAYEDPIIARTVAQAEAEAYLTSQYLPALRAATPVISQLTSPHHGNAGTIAITGTASSTTSASGIDYTITGNSTLNPVSPGTTAPTTSSTITEATPSGMTNPAHTSPSSATPATSQNGIPSTAGPTNGTINPGSPTPQTTSTAPTNIGATNSPTGATTGGNNGTVRPSGMGSHTTPIAQTAQSARHNPAFHPGIGGNTLRTRPPHRTSELGHSFHAAPGAGTATGHTPNSNTGTHTRGIRPPSAMPTTQETTTHTGTTRSGASGASSQSNQTRTNTIYGTRPPHNNRHDDHNSVHSVRHTPHDYEQNEYQSELFGPNPTTIPSVITGAVRN